MRQLLESKWLNFIRIFHSNKLEFDSNNNQCFIIKNSFEAEIEISNDYGFLCLKFRNKIDLSGFISNTGIIFEKTIEGKFEWRNTSWLNENFPCRVFISNDNKILSFYDSELVESDQKCLENRIITLQNVMHSIIDWKVSRGLNQLS